MCRVNYWLSCCLDCFVVSSSCAVRISFFDNYLRVRVQCVQPVRSFSRINVSWNVSRELLIIVLFGLFCCVIVVWRAQFIFDTYLHVCLQFVQSVSSFSRRMIFLEICRVNYWLSCCLDCFVGSSLLWCAQFILWQMLACSRTIRAARKFIFANKCIL